MVGSPIVPTPSEAILSFGPLLLLFLAALAILAYVVCDIYRRAKTTKVPYPFPRGRDETSE